MSGKFVLVGEPMGLFIAEQQGKLSEVEHFSSSVAGAEYNVAVALSRLGHVAQYCTKLGKDPFGDKIFAGLEKNNIGTDFVMRVSDRLTGFMMKTSTIAGDPEIFYYRKNSAASSISSEDIDNLDLSGCEFLHITGITPAISQSACAAVKRLIERGKENNLTISFDPNLRPQLWASREEMVETLNYLAKFADIVLPGVKEGEILAGTGNERKIAEFYHNMGVKSVIVKLGEKGAYYSEMSGESGYAPAFTVNKIVDTVGAGDGFASGVISAIAEGFSLKEAAERGNIIGAIQITVKSDNEGLPTREELEAVIKKGSV